MRESWPSVTLGDLASVAISGVDKHILPGEELVRLCNYLDVYRNRRLTRAHQFSAGSATKSEAERFRLKKGDVVITKDSETPDDIGVPTLIVDELEKVVCGYHLAMIRPTERLSSELLLHLFQSDNAKRHFLRTATGITRFGLGTSAIKTLPFSVPQIAEQAAIARVLDAVDQVIEQARAAIDAADDLRESLIAELLSMGVDTAGRVRHLDAGSAGFHRTPMGVLPATWRPSSLECEFEIKNGITLNEAQRARHPKRPYLRVANVQRDALKLDDVKELEASDHEVASRFLALDDLLVVEGHADRMQIGRCARVTEQAVGMTFQNHLFRLRSKGEVLPAFGCLWLNSSHAQRYWNARCATSSGLNTINQRMLKRLAIPVPPIEEQRLIADIIEKQRTHMDALKAKRDGLEKLKKSLLHDLLTGTVRLDPALFAETSA